MKAESINWNAFDPLCPTRALLDRIGDKWTVLIMVALQGGAMRFGALRRELGNIAPKVLTSKLRGLEEDGLLVRRVLATSPVSVEYELTAMGQSLHRVIGKLKDWAEQNMAEVLKARALAERNAVP